MGCSRQPEAPVGFWKRRRWSAFDRTKGYSYDHKAQNKKPGPIMNSMQDMIEPVRCKTVMHGAMRSLYAATCRVLNKDEQRNHPMQGNLIPMVALGLGALRHTRLHHEEANKLFSSQCPTLFRPSEPVDAGVNEDFTIRPRARIIETKPRCFEEMTLPVVWVIMECMSRKVLTFFLAFAIVLVGYQPFQGMTAAAQTAPMEMSAGSDGDCPEMVKDDCCDKTQKDKRVCLWNDACAARCHVNAGLEAAFIAPAMVVIPPQIITLAAPPPLHAARAGPLFRPPII